MNITERHNKLRDYIRDLDEINTDIATDFGDEADSVDHHIGMAIAEINVLLNNPCPPPVGGMQ